MRRKDYVAVADAILNVRIGINTMIPAHQTIALETLHELGTLLAIKFRRDNPRFDTNLFMAQSGLEENKNG